MNTSNVYNYSEFEDIPKSIRSLPDPENHLLTGISMLEIFNDRFVTLRNIKEVKDILVNYFDIKLKEKRLEFIKIYIGEYKKVFLGVYLFRIRVYVDYD